MKIKLFSLFALGPIAVAFAAPLTSTTAVHSKPNAASSVLTILSAGTEPKPAIGVHEALSTGWTAIELDGVHDAFIANKDFDKEMNVKPGAIFRTLPKATAPELGKMEPGDQVEITNYKGRYTEVKVTKRVVGYIQGWHSGVTSTRASVAMTTAAVIPQTPSPTPRPVAPEPFSPAPVAPAAVSGVGQAVNLGDGGASSLPRLFQGKFVSSRSLLHPRRPYDYQLNDSAGERYTYLDVSKLLQTEQIDKYIDHTVSVYGTARQIEGTKDIVVSVESLQLR
jgi:hypothetical protein